MLLSLNWLREFVDLPADLDARVLAERFTVTTAEVEGVTHVTRPPDGLRPAPGDPLPPAELDDWIIEIDNKSITHRPDLWGHYGVARELAALLGRPLRPYPVAPPEELGDPASPAIPIEIDDPRLCPRYSGVVIRGMRPGPSPAVMQVRLARCGMRPIDLLVDLTNYVMLELGQPMHAFDAAKVGRIEVATAAPGERFRTLDGVERVMPPGTLMIQCGRRSVAVAGIMGGAETEVGPSTTAVLLESACFDAATIRRAASAMGLRTEASARFEKSLDPENTVRGLARFVSLARRQQPGLTFGSRLSDGYPRPAAVRPIEVDPAAAERLIGAPVAATEMARILTALEFAVAPRGERLLVTPPSFRATRDITLAADVVEEVSRFVGYGNIRPALPRVTTRYLGDAPELRLERRTLECLCVAGRFVEVHGYLWYDDDWLVALGHDPGPCLRLRNPAAAGCGRLRRSLVPGLLRAVERNRHHFQEFHLLEIGTVVRPPAGAPDAAPGAAAGTAAAGSLAETDVVDRAQGRRLALTDARSGPREADAVWAKLKSALEGWARQVLEAPLSLAEAEPGPDAPWEDPVRTADVLVDGRRAGRATCWSLANRQRIDERLRAWSVALAEVNLSGLADLVGRHERLAPVPAHPRVRLDFSFIADARRRYAQIAEDLSAFEHPLLCGLTYVGAFEGKPVPPGKRSLTVRAEIGAADRTLADADVQQFRAAFTTFLEKLNLSLRA